MKYLRFLLVLSLSLLIGCGELIQHSEKYKSVKYLCADSHRKSYAQDPELYQKIFRDIHKSMQRQKNYLRFIVIDPNVVGEFK